MLVPLPVLVIKAPLIEAALEIVLVLLEVVALNLLGDRIGVANRAPIECLDIAPSTQRRDVRVAIFLFDALQIFGCQNWRIDFVRLFLILIDFFYPDKMIIVCE